VGLASSFAVGAFVATSAFAPADVAAAATVPTPRTPDAVAATSLSGTPRVTTPDAAATRALSVVPVREQAFEQTRVEPAPTPAGTPITLATATPEDTVRAARAVSPATSTPGLEAGDRVNATVSFYYCRVGSSGAHGDGGGFCGRMRDGSVVYSGAAACDYKYLGQRFRIQGDPSGRVYRCADTGSAVHGLHRDIWFATNEEGWAWQRIMGQTATIEILP